MLILLSRCPSVRAIRPPNGAALAPFYDEATFADAFAIRLDGSGPHDLERLARRALERPGPGLRAAMGLRDRAVSLFGIKTSGDIRDRLLAARAGRIGLFPVKSRTEREIVVGEDDRHLDFRLSLSLQPAPDGETDLVATTVVHCNNGLGHIYLAAIMPGHKLIVRSLLRKAVRGTGRP